MLMAQHMQLNGMGQEGDEEGNYEDGEEMDGYGQESDGYGEEIDEEDGQQQ